MQPKAEALQADISGRQKKIDALQKRINDVKDRVFADFSKKVGSAGPGALEQDASVVTLVDQQTSSKAFAVSPRSAVVVTST